MISLEERKLALFIQTNLLRRELENLQREEQEKLHQRSNTGNKADTGFIELVASLNNEEK